jgi:hypothetical protein
MDGLVFLRDHMTQEVIVGEVLLSRQLEIIIPVGQQGFKPKVLELVDQFGTFRDWKPASWFRTWGNGADKSRHSGSPSMTDSCPPSPMGRK